MSMTKEEAIEALQKFVNGYEKNICGEAVRQNGFVQAIKVVISALRPVTREQVRRGKWEKIGADYRGQGGIWKCTACGKTYPYKCDFCPNCGAPMTDKAVDMVMERLEALQSEIR